MYTINLFDLADKANPQEKVDLLVTDFDVKMVVDQPNLQVEGFWCAEQYLT